MYTQHTCTYNYTGDIFSIPVHVQVCIGTLPTCTFGSTMLNCTTSIFSMGATVQMECNIRRYCMLLGVISILHVTRGDITRC